MARDASADVLRPSIVDRLIEPSRPGGAFHGTGVRELREAVARDLEWLLNTRVWCPWENLERLEEARASILSYGMPELSKFSWSAPEDARTIAGLIERAVRSFEPRLLPRSVKCEVVPSEKMSDFSLRIRIEAVLQVEPISEPVAFDAGFDLGGGGLHIESFE
jgi:type VI secretion system protein ImpF